MSGHNAEGLVSCVPVECACKAELSLTLIRHAPTSHNLLGVYMGGLDIPLSAAGEVAALRARDQFAVERYDAYFCSPLRRAVSTAEILFPGAILGVDGRLSERSLGLWEGQLKKGVFEQFPQAFRQSGMLKPDYCPPGGEGVENLLGRVQSFLFSITYLAAAFPAPPYRVVVVTHNGIIRAFRSILEGGGFEVFPEEPHLVSRMYSLVLVS